MVTTPGQPSVVPRVLLLDIGGVVLRSGIELVESLATRDPRLRPAVDAIGGVASAHDVLWQEMQRGEISEREYWARRAVALGTSVGEAWDTRALIDRLYDAPEEVWLRPEAIALMKDVAAAGLGVGALTNDLSAFHGPDWVDAQWWVAEFDHVVDASVNGILKPDPRAYALGCEAFDAQPGEVVFVDDMPANIDGAEAAGLVAVRLHYDDPTAAFDRAREHLGLV